MQTTHFIMIRHGETFWNAEGRLQGQADSPLTPRGLAQASAVAWRLQHESFTALYASHLKRVLDTAAPIAASSGHSITIDERLQERAYGIFEGLTYAEASVQHPAIFHEYQTNLSPDFALPQAESTNQLLARGQQVFAELAERHPGEQIVIVSHGSFLRVMLSHMLGIPLDSKQRFRLANGSLSEATWRNGEWQVLTLGEVYHLRDVVV